MRKKPDKHAYAVEQQATEVNAFTVIKTLELNNKLQRTYCVAYYSAYCRSICLTLGFFCMLTPI